ncbi:MAG TPA: hypothetical protein VFL94_09530 [Actinomycetales bacterium]|nr:hypothetical protein [Actinomycetales bacterium]
MKATGTVAGERARRTSRRLLLHSRAQLVVKTTVAATLAWLAGGLVGGQVGEYRYYAPLGAVAMTYPTIATTVRQASHGILAIGLGGGLGLIVHTTLQTDLLGIVVVVAVGVALAGLPLLGEQRSYVPVVALLVVIIGGRNPQDYALAYVVMSLLGAAVGVVVSVALPALRLSPGHEALRSVEALLADQLHDVAEVLRSGEQPEADEWDRRLRSARPFVEDMRRRVGEARDAQRGNPRARRRGYPANHLQRIARSLERVTPLVEQVLDLVSRTYRHGLTSPLDRQLAHAAADALDRIADLVRSYHEPIEPDDEKVVDGQRALTRLQEAFAERRDMDADDLAAVGAIVATLRLCLLTVEPAGAR